MTDYAGIDYGLGRTNMDNSNGIRYGIISVHTVGQDAIGDIYDSGDNLSYAAAVVEVKRMIQSAIQPTLDELGVLPYNWSGKSEKRDAYIATVVDGIWEGIADEWNDQYQEDNDQYEYAAHGYVLQTSSLGLMVIASPYYTFAQFCSPCVPGAGNLDTPCETGPKTYCLGPEWFDNDRAPYPVYRVADDTKVVS